MSAMRFFCSASTLPSMVSKRSMCCLSPSRTKCTSACTAVTGHCLRSAYMRKVPAALATHAEGGLWLGLVLLLAPLIVLGLPAAADPRNDRGSLFPVVTLLIAVG